MAISFVFMTYVAIRGIGLPIYVYPAFPASAVFVMGLIFSISCDAVGAKRASEEILDILHRSLLVSLRGIGVLERKELLMHSKAFRPASFPVGNFGDVTLGLPFGGWEQALDLLLVLLTM